MTSKGISRIMQGVLRYQSTRRADVARDVRALRENPGHIHPEALYITCMDSRLQPSMTTQTHVGDMYVIRNSGNLVPHSDHCGEDLWKHPSCETAALDLCCVRSNVGNVIVTGHSDCKAMNALYDVVSTVAAGEREGPLHTYLRSYAVPTIMKMQQLLRSPNMEGPLEFSVTPRHRSFRAFIDPEHELSEMDKLSQVNVLQQMENISSLSFLQTHLGDELVNLHAWWFNLTTGEYHMFSPRDERFIKLTEESAAAMLGIVGKE
ncbi:PREDICTED: beta carbonic anhydrase 1-like [Priapulus caudatus]|uniref:Carbonic anhydrase n=1 Tax=Priapulus caudatus TaxID=37621 RepID=A0ABM1FBF7_PRICU|nr:PREDICTED: beta carbonic anhydrase 1-like [Priapulus caudatus]